MRGVELTWQGGEHRFVLTIEHLRALQDRCDAGPAFVLARLGSGRWMIDDVVSTIRLGLEGGGMEKEAARKMVRQHVEDRPLMQSVPTARAVLAASLIGDEDDPVGELAAGEGADSTATSSRAERSDGQASTVGQAFSAATSAE